MPTPRSAFENKSTHIPLEAKGNVAKVLSDDIEDTPHQRFIIRCVDGQTILIAHNLDRASRVPLNVGDEISVRGEYVWNEKGGLIHETHEASENQHLNGWVKLNGRKYS
jgi:hypothetical protein